MSLVVADRTVADPSPRVLYAVPRSSWTPPAVTELVGVSDHIVRLRASCAAVGPLPRRVAITGETGTGKGLVARLLHQYSARAGPFIQRGAGETAPSLLQDELFGHVRGAFTGATERRVGLLEAADGGPLFLDELQDLSTEVQRALLLFLDGHGFAPQGTYRRIQPEVRLISAAQRPLGELVEEGLLRRDLLYRLRQVTIVLRPLRERPEDVGPIAESVLRRHPGRGPDGRGAMLSARTLALLERHPWPGNVRELAAAVDTAAWMALGGETIEPEHLPEWFFEEMGECPRPSVAGESGLEAALRATSGNVAAAARRMGVCSKTVRRRIASGGLDLAAIRREGSGSARCGGRLQSAGGGTNAAGQSAQ
jgi:DNA-binding NtrC family response regulator